MDNETIVAIATPPGMGGIGIVRMSGPDSEKILNSLFCPAGKQKLPLENRKLTFGYVLENGETVDECLAVVMRAPGSYTREDVVELQIHGGIHVINHVMMLCIRYGARTAKAGEFTMRAFLNGRIDLSQAEAVMNLISARGDQQARAAIRQMEGGTGDFIRSASDRLYQLQAGLAACIDYPEEISEEEGAGELKKGLAELIGYLENAMDTHSSRLINEGLYVTLFGTPNAGKSSLLNAFLEQEKAIVTDIPGTTRDIIEGEITVNGIRVHLIDTAGLRETEDPIEKIGVEKAEKALHVSDLRLLVLDGTRLLTEEEQGIIQKENNQCAVLINKSDLEQTVTVEMVHRINSKLKVLKVSAMDRTTLQPVVEMISDMTRTSDRINIIQPRHIEAAEKAISFLKAALSTVENWTPDMASTELQSAQSALGEITGDQVDERLLDHVFSSFCVGK